MTPELYRICARYAGEWLLASDDRTYAIGSGEELPDYSCAVYIAYGTDGIVDYVGSVDRALPGGAHQRLSEHLRDNERFRSWNGVVLIPLQPGTPHRAVLQTEGRVGAHLAPRRNRRLPRLGRGGTN
jgi:hypothetical protein